MLHKDRVNTYLDQIKEDEIKYERYYLDQLHKECTKCGDYKLATLFPKGKNYKDGFRSHCKACVDQYNEAIRDDRLSYSKAYYKANKDRRRSYFAYKTRQRDAVKLKATVSWANEDVIREFYEAAQVLKDVTGITYHVDHIIPLQGKNVCGLHVETNLQLLEASDNLVKSNKF